MSGVRLQSAAPHAWTARAKAGANASWDAFTRDVGPAWATWSEGHPHQIIASGLEAPGTIASADEAERVARDVLARHLPLLAPGTTPDDFVLVSNERSAGIRSVGFQQYAGGREVVGGQIGLSFKHDRLVMITSQAKTDVLVPRSAARVSDSDARARAREWIGGEFSPSALRTTGAVEGPLVLPVGDAVTGPRYHEVVRVELETEAPLDRWWVYVDAQTGAPVARESRMRHASGIVYYNVPERSPIFARSDRPTPFTQHTVDELPQVSNAAGVVEFAGPVASVQPGLGGPSAQIIDEQAPFASGVLPLSDGGVAVWSQAEDELFDAQLSTYAHTLVVKNYVRTLGADLAWLDESIRLIVNIDDQCNAMSDGDSLYFFASSANCENTGRMSDVVYHEFGHSIHFQSLIPGVGSFDGALSEGISDYLAATLVNDSGMGRGFFYTQDALRELDPAGFEWTWPEDNGEVHDAGRIIGGALWDLRKLLILKYGLAEGIRRTDVLWYESIRRAVDMPSMYGAALLVNDDDGDLANGTPDVCEINAAFGSHGLFSSSSENAERVSVEPAGPDGLIVRVDLSLPSFDACPLEATARLEWIAREDRGNPPQAIPMTPVDGGFVAAAPALPDGQVLNYRVVLDYSNGAQRVVPTNLGDPWFEHWFGPVEPIYCTSFEEGGAPGWELPATWEVAVPQGGSGDPGVSAGPDPFVLGMDLGPNGLYRPLTSETAVSPIISIPSRYESVRLHYRRWLTVEDGFYDQAFILADDELAWSNFASLDDFDATTHHRDAQWVFHDVDLTPWAEDGEVELAFSLESDGGLEMGGWAIDELCVVGYLPSAPPIACGNGILEDGEQCDDGNAQPGDGCSDQCRFESDDDGGGDDDDGDVDDDGGDDDDGDDDDGLIDRGCACQARSSDDGHRGLGLMALVLLGWRRRRRA